jgi:hypothetical protein
MDEPGWRPGLRDSATHSLLAAYPQCSSTTRPRNGGLVELAETNGVRVKLQRLKAALACGV